MAAAKKTKKSTPKKSTTTATKKSAPARKTAAVKKKLSGAKAFVAKLKEQRSKVKGVVQRAVSKVKGTVKARAAARKTPAVSPSAELTIEQWVAKKIDASQVPIASAILALVAEAAPDAKGVIKWGQPVFELNGPMAYFRGSKSHVTFGFWRGTQLTDPTGLLEGEGDRMKHIKLTDAASIPRDALKQFVQQAAQLNREHGSPAMRGAK